MSPCESFVCFVRVLSVLAWFGRCLGPPAFMVPRSVASLRVCGDESARGLVTEPVRRFVVVKLSRCVCCIVRRCVVELSSRWLDALMCRRAAVWLRRGVDESVRA